MIFAGESFNVKLVISFPILQPPASFISTMIIDPLGLATKP